MQSYSFSASVKTTIGLLSQYLIKPDSYKNLAIEQMILNLVAFMRPALANSYLVKQYLSLQLFF
jgi:hypothetical protein